MHRWPLPVRRDHRGGLRGRPSRDRSLERRGHRQPGRTHRRASRLCVRERSSVPEARLVSATCAGIRCHSLYVPNGRTLDDPHYTYKLAWLDRLGAQLGDELDRGLDVVAGGDFNVAPTSADIYDPRRWVGKTHASPAERERLAAIEALGYTDAVRHLCPEPELYTWWSYRPGQLEQNRGLRIDLIFTSPKVTERLAEAWVDRAERAAVRPSDHAPVGIRLTG
ncbi:MAG: exodeoxyribonuclease III [Ilumatobacteraceae bacterium]